MYIVTGGAGFIGSHIVEQLNNSGHTDILVVDNLKNGHLFQNLASLQISDYQDKQAFLDKLFSDYFATLPITAIFHQGACSTTTEWDGRYMMENNYEYSKAVLHFCQQRNIPLIYASSAAVYGASQDCAEQQPDYVPLNVYGYSKYLFDQYVFARRNQLTSQVIGLRYFNVYGPREGHKQRMASMAYHLQRQVKQEKVARLFDASQHCKAGEQSRDFVYAADAAQLNLWFLDNPQLSGVFNIGTGTSRSFNALATLIIDYYQQGQIEYIPFPDDLRNSYQEYTCADLTALRSAGCDYQFKALEQAVPDYLVWLDSCA